MITCVSTFDNLCFLKQNFQGHGLLRPSSVGSPGSPSPNTSQSMQSLNQPWLSSGSQGKPPLPSPSFRQQVTSPSLQQRSHLQQQQPHSLPMASQQLHMTASQQQQPSTSHQSHEHYGQQVPSPRIPPALPHQQQVTRVAQSSLPQKSSPPTISQPNMVQSGPQNRTGTTEIDESSNRILSKRSIHELVNQASIIFHLLEISNLLNLCHLYYYFFLTRFFIFILLVLLNGKTKGF